MNFISSSHSFLGTKKLPGKVYAFRDVWTCWILKTRQFQVISTKLRSYYRNMSFSKEDMQLTQPYCLILRSRLAIQISACNTYTVKKNKSPSYIIFKAILYISQWKRKPLHLLCKQNGTWVTFLQQQLPSKGNYSPSRAWTNCFSQKEETLSMTQYVWKALSVSLGPWHVKLSYPTAVFKPRGNPGCSSKPGSFRMDPTLSWHSHRLHHQPFVQTVHKTKH